MAKLEVDDDLIRLVSVTGPQGPRGPEGPKGPKGDPGVTLIQERIVIEGQAVGDTGPEGPVGPQGAPGEAGVQGKLGRPGPQGLRGTEGPVGPLGPKGEIGPKGPKGDQGIEGRGGGGGTALPAGGSLGDYLGVVSTLGSEKIGWITPTESSTVAVFPVYPQEEGEEGSIGPTGLAGAQGADGAAGIQGPAGAAGVVGLDGPEGDEGFQGPPGASATLIKSTYEPNLGSTVVTQGEFTITSSYISPTSIVLVSQAPGPYTSKGTMSDEAELSPVDIVLVTPIQGSALVNWLGKGYTGATGNRIGSVKGQVKFNYAIF